MKFYDIIGREGSDEMKKGKIRLFILLIILCITGCTSKTGKFESITFNEYQQLIENKESFILEVMSSDCTHCKSLKPKLQNVINNYGITIKTINLEKLSNKDYQEFTNIIGSKATPTILFYKNGYESSVSTRIIGDVTKERIIEKMKDNGIIK